MWSAVFCSPAIASISFANATDATAVVPNRRIGILYGVGALALSCLAIVFWPGGVALLWPAVALAIAAAGYFSLGAGIYRKRDGLIPLSSWFALAPVLVGQYLSLRYYRRHCRDWDAVTPNVWIGRALSRREAAAAVEAGVVAVLDVTAEFSAADAFSRGLLSERADPRSHCSDAAAARDDG